MREVAVAALVAGSFSGLPSTVHAVATGRSALQAARAAGTLLGRQGLVRGLIAHAAMSVAWAAVLRAVLPPARRTSAGAAAGLGIAALDLSIAERRYPAIAELPRLPQIADHVALGALVGATLDVTSRAWRRRCGP